MMNLNSFVSCVSTMYAAHSNEERRAATVEVLNAESRMSAQEMLQTGVGLLQCSTHGVAVQAYGAVLLRRGVMSGHLAADAVPYVDILTWYLNEPTLGRLLCKDLIDLITECMVYEWPEKFPDLMDLVCPTQGQLSKQPRKISLLCALVVKFMDPHSGRVPVCLMKKLKSSIVNCAKRILGSVTQALFDMYTAAGGEGSCCFAEDTSESVSDCLTIFVNLVPSLSVSHWWQLGLDSTMLVLVRWKPAAQEALAATASLFRCDAMSTAAVGPELTGLFTAVLDGVGACVAERNYGLLEEIADLLLELPDPILRGVVASVSRSCLAILAVPSIYIASHVCLILRRLGDAVFPHINPMELLTRLAALMPKNQYHPETGVEGEGKRLSREQYGVVKSFEHGFAEFRGLVGYLLTSLARVYPIVCNQFILHLFTTLCDGRGTWEDPRTSSGFVTQQSVTFCTWEATQFLVQHLSEAYKFSSDHVPQAIAAFVEKETQDMVLCPVYLNMVSTFWNCRDDAALGVWEGTLSILFACLEHKSNWPNDIDAMSARKRALTLLVNACTQHAQRLVHFKESFLRRLENLLMVSSTSQYERTLLYEAMSAFTVALPADEAQERLQSFFGPMMRMLIQSMQSMDQMRFNDIITARTSDLLSERDMLRNGVTIIAGVLRHCKTSPYLVESSTTLAPAVLQLMDLIHNIRADELPPEYACIVEMDHHTREQYLPGVSRKSVTRLSMQQKARNGLMELRSSLYQVVGALSGFLPTETFRGMMQPLTSSVRLLPTHVVRSLAVHCMFLVGNAHPNLISEILSTCGVFFSQRADRASQRPEDDVIDSKQLFFFSKEVFGFMRQHVVEKKLLEGNPTLIRLVIEVALAILVSGSNIHEASRFVSTTLSAARKSCGAMTSLETQIDEVAVFAFGRMLDFVLRADDAMLPPKDRERLVYLLSDIYVEGYPRYVAALGSRFPREKVDDLHTKLMMSQRFDLKRRSFYEFLSRGETRRVNPN